jgi:FMN phosphatase YigB (HAD superfamily)
VRPTIVVDLDGTLCDSSHREHLAVNKEWDAFHAAGKIDEPHGDVLWLLRNLPPDTTMIGLTGRNERYRLQTVEWLTNHDIFFDELLMRPDDDFTSDHILKPDMLGHWRERNPDASIICVLEDRDRVVENWRNLGYNCWQVRPGGY